MGERKVLNKYYPPDFDSIKLPKLPGGRPDQYVIRIMAPFTMRCITCGHYVYKGKKFNSRKEDAKGEKYLGIQIYRFYIRCPECLSEITFKTDPQNADYVPEHGAVRTFQAERLAELEEQREAEEKEEEEANNPMLALENRTAESRMEMDVLDALEEIRDWNARNASVKHEQLLEGLLTAEEKEKEEEEAVMAKLVGKVFAEKRERVRRLEDTQLEEAPPPKQPRTDRTLSSSKKQLSELVIRKTDKVQNKTPVKSDKDGPSEVDSREEVAPSGGCPPVIGGLGLLCDYSDSSGDSD